MSYRNDKKKEKTRMPRCLPTDSRGTETEAQHVVCGYLVRGCQQAIYDLALDDSRESDVRHQAIQALRVILDDWRQARNTLRDELRERRPTFTGR